MTLPDAAFDVYFSDHDAVIECGACDADYGDAAEWPEWVDADRWEPSEADTQWLAENSILPPLSGGSPEPFEPSDADLDEMAAWSGALTDEDLMAAGLAVG